jgi:hypothetical protein
LLKRKAGWYEKDFHGDERVMARQLAAKRKTDAKAAGVNWSDEPELRKGGPVETFPGLVRGRPAISTDEILTMYDGYFVEDGPSNRGLSTDGIDNMWPGRLTDTDPNWSTDEILKRYTGVLTDQESERGDKKRRIE